MQRVICTLPSRAGLGSALASEHKEWNSFVLLLTVLPCCPLLKPSVELVLICFDPRWTNCHPTANIKHAPYTSKHLLRSCEAGGFGGSSHTVWVSVAWTGGESFDPSLVSLGTWTYTTNTEKENTRITAQHI